MKVSLDGREVVVLVESEQETAQLGGVMAALVTPGTVIGLVGPLGAGKTRLARAIAEALGADPSAIASPTFVLIHEYEGDLPIFHFDTYRLRSPEEFESLGAAEYYDAGGVCLIEWADRVADLLPSDVWWVEIEPEGQARRLRLRLPQSATLAESLTR